MCTRVVRIIGSVFEPARDIGVCSPKVGAIVVLALCLALTACDTFTTIARTTRACVTWDASKVRGAIIEISDCHIRNEYRKTGVYYIEVERRGTAAWVELEAGRARIGSTWIGRDPGPEEQRNARDLHLRLEEALAAASSNGKR